MLNEASHTTWHPPHGRAKPKDQTIVSYVGVAMCPHRVHVLQTNFDAGSRYHTQLSFFILIFFIFQL
jgi:hypothetical protein